MQAGEKLSFVTPFEGERQIDDEEQGVIADAFIYLHRKLLASDSSTTKSVERFEMTGFVTILEASYKVASLDGSYLHILAFEHSDKDGLMDAGISVIEHSNTGVYVGGYLYYLDADGLTRDTCKPDEDEEEDTAHFSVLELYASTSALEMILAQTDDESEKEEALRIKEKIDEEIAIGNMEKDMGYDQQPPTLEELISLQSLLRHAEPFTPPAEEVDDDQDRDIYR